MFTTTIDWLSFTMKGNLTHVSEMLAYLNPSGIMEPTKPKFGYARASRLPNGVDMLSSRDGEGMGTHFVISGSALRSLASEGCSGLDVLKRCIAYGAQVTRLDLAKDAKDEQSGLVTVSEHASNGIYSGTAQKAAVIKSSDGGTTVYIGSRQSERFVRFYDKGVESGEGGNWKRLELECKGKTANLMARAIVHDEATLNVLIGTTVRRMFMIEDADWQNMLAAEADYDLPKIEKQTDRERWIETQVASAVITHLDEHPDSQAIKRLYEMLKERFE